MRIIEILQQIKDLLKDIHVKDKDVLSFQEACVYMDVSKSFLYQKTASADIRHFKPSGKMIYFLKTDLDEFLLTNEFSSNFKNSKVN